MLRESDLPEPVPQYTPPWNAHIRSTSPTPPMALPSSGTRSDGIPPPSGSNPIDERDRVAVQNGWVVLRFTWRDVFDTPAVVVSEVGAVLRERATLAG